ncbi:MAG: hypothetical protein Aurels2KO_37110 [Aureliella sp.]
MLSDVLRRKILDSDSIASVARGAAVSQSTLQEFAVGKSDGTFADLRLSSVEKLCEFFGLELTDTSQSNVSKGVRRMALVAELGACGVEDSADRFRSQLLAALPVVCEGMTIDSMLCNPTASLRFCEHIRDTHGAESLHDALILRTLINIRKSKDCPPGLGGKGPRRSLKRELANSNCAMTAAEFRDFVGDCLASMYKGRTVDEIVCYPRQAMSLCNFTRRKSACSALDDSLILGTLMNVRKSSNS